MRKNGKKAKTKKQLRLHGPRKKDTRQEVKEEILLLTLKKLKDYKGIS